MNAYELAKAQQAYSAPTLEEIIKQQANRIAELEKECHWAKDQWDKDRICFKARIAELEEQNHWLTNNPLKELSDEEIQSIWNEGIVGWYATQEESVLKFAREILKKASEK